MSLLNVLYHSDWILSLYWTIFVILTPDHWCLKSCLSVSVPFVKICLDELESFSVVPHLSLTCSSAFPSTTFLCHCPSAILSLFVSLGKSLVVSLNVQIMSLLSYYIAHFFPKADTHAVNQHGAHHIEYTVTTLCFAWSWRLDTHSHSQNWRKTTTKLSHLQWHVSRLFWCELRRYQLPGCLLSLDCNGTNWHIAYSVQGAKNAIL